MAAVNLFHPYPSKKFAAVIAADAHSSFNELLLTKQTSRRREFVDVSEIHDIVLVVISSHYAKFNFGGKIQIWIIFTTHHSSRKNDKSQSFSEFFSVFSKKNFKFHTTNRFFWKFFSRWMFLTSYFENTRCSIGRRECFRRGHFVDESKITRLLFTLSVYFSFFFRKNPFL